MEKGRGGTIKNSEAADGRRERSESELEEEIIAAQGKNGAYQRAAGFLSRDWMRRDGGRSTMEGKTEYQKKSRHTRKCKKECLDLAVKLEGLLVRILFNLLVRTGRECVCASVCGYLWLSFSAAFLRVGLLVGVIFITLKGGIKKAQI